MTELASAAPAPSASQSAAKPIWLGVRRGVAHKCPNCGDGKLYRSYLKVVGECEACGHVLSAYPADDGPAYFTILIIGHLVVAPLLLMPFIWQWSPFLVLPLTMIPLAALTLAVLPRVKGAVIGVLWAQKQGREATLGH
jgi:uncharacterized protein (DUF983 family)